jgi:hypothetical protein
MFAEHAGHPFTTTTPTPPVIPIRAIDNEQLAVIARDQPEPSTQAGRVEHCDLDAAPVASCAGIFARCPVLQIQSNSRRTFTPRAAARTKRIREPVADLIGALKM